MGWGIGIGIGWPNASAGISYAKKLIKAFKERVLSYPNSIFEAEACLDATLTELNAIGLLKKASLVITPNAYNESILYDVVPNTTLGDMGVVRATTATRVNSAGLIEVVPRNLVTYSNGFTNPIWTKTGSTITPNTTISPDGSTNASTLTFTSTNQLIAQSCLTAGTNVTGSFYLKGIDGQTVRIAVGGVDLLITLTGNWQRFTLNRPTTTDTYLGVNTFGGATARVLQIYGFQAEIGSSATEYLPTTTRLNIPRIDYSNGSCPSLLVEPQRTNLNSTSNLSGWGATPTITRTLNTTDLLSPDGSNNATKLVSTLTTGDISNVISVANGAVTFSFYGRVLSGSQTIQVNVRNNSGTIVSLFPTLTTQWQRFTIINSNISVGSSGAVWFYPNSISTIYIYGAQMEQGSYATSYIPTVGSIVTRNADVISKTGISSLIGQTEGTIFIDTYIDDFVKQTNEPVLVYIKGVGNIACFIEITPSAIIGAYNDGSTFTGLITAGIVPYNGRYKIAFAYKNNDFVLYYNGVQLGVDTSGLVSGTLTSFGLQYDVAQYIGKQSVNSAQLYNTRLTNSELVQLTTI